MAKNRGIFINRDCIVEKITRIGNENWTDFVANELNQVGNAYRCEMIADGKKAMLDFYFRNDGTTSINSTGTNIDISQYVKAALESTAKYIGNDETKTYSFKKLSNEWSSKLVGYLKSIEGMHYTAEKKDTQPIHMEYIFTSTYGDKLHINQYENGTLVLQGKPAYVYGEAISFLSYSNEVTVDKIVESISVLHNVDVNTSDVHVELKGLLPKSYSGLDTVILKILSPSVALRKISVDLEDYSCFAFPALRALEAYIKWVLGKKNVNVGDSFAGVFSGYNLTENAKNKINNTTYQREVERVFKYFKDNRHVHFHTEQILIGTKLIENRTEAEEIINSCIQLIETSYDNMNI